LFIKKPTKNFCEQKTCFVHTNETGFFQDLGTRKDYSWQQVSHGTLLRKKRGGIHPAAGLLQAFGYVTGTIIKGGRGALACSSVFY